MAINGSRSRLAFLTAAPSVAAVCIAVVCIAAFFTAGLCTVPTAVFARSQYGSQARQVHALLNAQHASISASKLRRIGRFVPVILHRAVLDSAASSEIAAAARARNALSLLVHFPKVAAPILCGRTTNRRELRARRVAILGCAAVASGNFLRQAARLINDPNAQIREVTVRALASIPAQGSAILLRRRLQVERESFIRTAIAAELAARASRRRGKQR